MMKTRRTLCAIGVCAVSLIACGDDGDDGDDGAADTEAPAAATVDDTAAADTATGEPSATAEGSQPTAEPTDSDQPAPDTTTAADEPSAGALEMWERSGGNAPMVDALVAAWNEANPDRPINLTYIPHTEMVPKLAQAI